MNTNWSNTTRILIILLALGTVIALAVLMAPLVNALFIAAIIAYLLDPAVRFLVDRTHLERFQAANLVFFFTMVILFSIPAALGTVAFNWVGRLGTDFLTAAQEIQNWLFRPITILGFRLQPQDLLGQLQGLGSDLLATLPGGSLNILSTVTTNLVWALVVIVMSYYFLKDGPRVKPWLIQLLPAEHQPEIERLVDKVNWVWGKFMRIQILMFLLIFALMALGTLLIVGLFRFGLLRWSPLGFVVLVVLLYTAIQQLDNLWLRPQILGRQLHLHPGVVFAGLIGALMLSGLLGALVVVPLIATVKVVGRYVHRKLLGLPPWPDEELIPAAQQDQVPGAAEKESQDVELAPASSSES